MSHSRRTPCCKSEAIRFLQEESLLETGHDGYWFDVDTLAAALEKYSPGLISGPRVEDYPPSKTRKGMQMARAIIKAAKEASEYE